MKPYVIVILCIVILLTPLLVAIIKPLLQKPKKSEYVPDAN